MRLVPLRNGLPPSEENARPYDRIRKKAIPKNPKNRTPPKIVEKVLHLRKTYHLGPIRIVWYLARYHDIKISGAGVSRILKRNGHQD